MPWNKKRYPIDWPKIRTAVLERARWCCEGSPAYPDCRAVNYAPHPVTGSHVVLTVAHLDHSSQTADMRLLRAMCNRCHLQFDLEQHMQNAARTRRRKKENSQQLTLF